MIQIDEGEIQEHLREVVRSTVEETLNVMLDTEADRLCRAERMNGLRPEEYSGRILPPAATDESGRSHAEDAEATHAVFEAGSREVLAVAEKDRMKTTKLKEMKLANATDRVRAGIVYAFPREHWRSMRTNNPLERILREVRRRTRAWERFRMANQH